MGYFLNYVFAACLACANLYKAQLHIVQKYKKQFMLKQNLHIFKN